MTWGIFPVCPPRRSDIEVGVGDAPVCIQSHPVERLLGLIEENLLCLRGGTARRRIWVHMGWPCVLTVPGPHTRVCGQGPVCTRVLTLYVTTGCVLS